MGKRVVYKAILTKGKEKNFWKIYTSEYVLSMQRLLRSALIKILQFTRLYTVKYH